MAAGVLTPASPYPAPSRPLLGILTPVRVAFLQLGPELCSDSQLRNVDFSASLHSGDEFKLSRPSLMESRDSELVQGRASKAFWGGKLPLARTALWTQVDRAIKELLQNRDLIETTADPHIVGYICNALVEAGVGRL